MSFQPKGPKPEELVPMIIWGALSLFMVFYLIVLMLLGKIQYVQFSGVSWSMLEMIALVSNCVLIISFFIHQKQVVGQSEKKKQLPFRIITWALNESPLIVALAATLISASGNGAVFFINLTSAFLANLVMFPRQ